jgi:hypothetical protein
VNYLYALQSGQSGKIGFLPRSTKARLFLRIDDRGEVFYGNDILAVAKVTKKALLNPSM